MARSFIAPKYAAIRTAACSIMSASDRICGIFAADRSRSAAGGHINE
jgi:hypothetical protein